MSGAGSLAYWGQDLVCMFCVTRPSINMSRLFPGLPVNVSLTIYIFISKLVAYPVKDIVQVRCKLVLLQISVDLSRPSLAFAENGAAMG